jgi:hypothetical protein
MFLTKQCASSRALPKHKERAVLPEKPEPELELVEKEPCQRGLTLNRLILLFSLYLCYYFYN